MGWWKERKSRNGQDLLTNLKRSVLLLRDFELPE